MDFLDLPEKVDLFKAIFLSSSDESNSEEEVDKEPKADNDDIVTGGMASIPIDKKAVASTPNLPKKPPAEVFKNTQRNTSPPRGIFANLDLDTINARKREVLESADVEVKPTESLVINETVDDLPEDVFGPRLPSNLHIPSSTATTSRTPCLEILPSVVASDSCWVEKLCKHPRKEKHSRKKSHKKDKKVLKHKKHKKHMKTKDKHKKKHKN